MPPHETPRLTFSGLQTIVSYNCLKCNRISSFRGDAKHRTRNLEIPRCAIAHLWSGPSDHPGMTVRPLRLQRTLRAGVDGIERGRAADVEPVALLAAEAEIGNSFRNMDLAEQFALWRVA